MQTSAVVKQMRSAAAAIWTKVIHHASVDRQNLINDPRLAQPELTKIAPFSTVYQTLIKLLEGATDRWDGLLASWGGGLD